MTGMRLPLLVSAALAVAAAGTGLYFGPSANLILRVPTKTVSTSIDIGLGSEQPVNGRRLAATVENTESAPVTGSPPTGYAMGAVVFQYLHQHCSGLAGCFNPAEIPPASVSMPSGTRLATCVGILKRLPPLSRSSPGTNTCTKTGAVFATLDAITIEAGATTAVPIRAITPGAAGNVAAEAIDFIMDEPPNINDYTRLVVGNPMPTSGGTTATMSVVAQSDIDRVIRTDMASLRQRTSADLAQQAQGGGLTLLGGPDYSIADQSDPPVGEAASQVSVRTTVTATQWAFSQDDLRARASAALQALAPVGTHVYKPSVTWGTLATLAAGPTERIIAVVSGFVSRLDADSVPGQYSGHLASSTIDQLHQMYAATVIVNQTPPDPWLPIDSARLTVELIPSGASLS